MVVAVVIEEVGLSRTVAEGLGRIKTQANKEINIHHNRGHIIVVKDVLLWVEAKVNITQTHFMRKAISCSVMNVTAQNIS